jgi:selenocysteine lyase/cysteine desulfurase
MIAYIRRELQLGSHEAARIAAVELAKTYDLLARLLGCNTDEVAIVDSGTRAWQMALTCLHFQPGDRILTVRNEYGSNLLAMHQSALRHGASVEFVETDYNGSISLEDLGRKLHPDVRLITLCHAPSNAGIINPADAVGLLARQEGIPFLLDCCQSVGQIETDVRELRCDMLCGTGRKWLRGPRGTAFLYVRKELSKQLEPPFANLHAGEWTPAGFSPSHDARMFETWEASYADRVGLSTAVEYALSWGIDNIRARVLHLSNLLRETLKAQPGVTVHDKGERLSGIVTFSVDDVPSAALRRRLRASKIRLSLCRAAHARLDSPPRDSLDLLRASPHYFNTEEEIAVLASALN